VIKALHGRPGIQAAMKTAIELAAANRFFHWPLEFPDVMAKGGFDVMLGNPPWQRIKLQEQEFFATRRREIAAAPNAAARRWMIEALKAAPEGSDDRKLYDEFEEAKRAAEAASESVRASGRFPLTAVGDVNTSALFAEDLLRLNNKRGRAGFIVPTGIATDSTTSAFFAEIASSRCLNSLIDIQTGLGFFDRIGPQGTSFACSPRPDAASRRQRRVSLLLALDDAQGA
jgi:hypothetical protein